MGVGVGAWSQLPVWGQLVLLLVGVSLVVEAALSWCPLKAASGLRKRSQKE
ncbi:MAG: DUF2892 domain-containing protein [Chloroflexi bacterium]|nr:DUF2892 domain-containing protein [Chloroflexota bacterium]